MDKHKIPALLIQTHTWSQHTGYPRHMAIRYLQINYDFLVLSQTIHEIEL
jgi:hypothetical protein